MLIKMEYGNLKAAKLSITQLKKMKMVEFLN